MAWVYRYLSSAERRDIFQDIRRMDGLASFLHEIDPAVSKYPIITTTIDIVGVSSYFIIANNLLPV